MLPESVIWADTGAKRIWDEGETIDPYCFLRAAWRSGKMQMIAVPLNTVPSKDLWRPVIGAARESIARAGGRVDEIVIVSEIWILQPPAGISRAELDRLYETGIRNHPLATEAVTYMLETRTDLGVRRRHWLRPVNSKTREWGELSESPGQNFDGRLANLLPADPGMN